MRDPIEMLLDENCNENIVLYNEAGEEIVFEQVAILPLDEMLYAILRPVMEQSVLADDEALVFEVILEENEAGLVVCEDDEIIDQVFEEYYDMLREAGIDV